MEFDYPAWPLLAEHGVPYADRPYSQRIATVQTALDSDVSARSRAAVERELTWFGLTGDERIFHPLCGPGGYAAAIRDGAGCRWYVGHDINPDALRWARRRAGSTSYHFRVARFGPMSPVPRHDLCLLTYETANLFPPEDLRRVIATVADRLSPGGRLFLDVRAVGEPGVNLGIHPPEWIAPGEGIFSASDHVLDYAVRLDHDGRLVVQRFRLTGGVTGEFYSWLWLHDLDEITAWARAAGMRPIGTAQLHRTADTEGSRQLCFQRVVPRPASDLEIRKR